MRLAAYFNPTGHHVASWRHPRAQADAGINFRHYIEIAQSSSAKFDMIFLADGVATREAHMDALSRWYSSSPSQPLTLLSALASVTDRIGLVATASTTYELSRRRKSPRSTTSAMAVPAGTASPPCSRRRRAISAGPASSRARCRTRAREFTRVVTELWDSWDDDAFVRDTVRGLFFDAEAACAAPQGEYYSVEGPLNVPRPPQAGR
jgi:alkanesulfonate monooxygenase